MNNKEVTMEVQMLNSYGCTLGTFTLQEVAKMLANGEVEAGDTFKIFEPEDD